VSWLDRRRSRQFGVVVGTRTIAITGCKPITGFRVKCGNAIRIIDADSLFIIETPRGSKMSTKVEVKKIPNSDLCAYAGRVRLYGFVTAVMECENTLHAALLKFDETNETDLAGQLTRQAVVGLADGARDSLQVLRPP
jgi:hypothetical protein